MAQRTSGNPANPSVGDPIRNAIFRDPNAVKSYKGVHGQIGFLLCAGNMRGILFDGKTCGGVAHWPLFAPNSDFSNFYALADNCLDVSALMDGCPPEDEEPTDEEIALCASTKIGADLTTGNSQLSWDGVLYSSSTITISNVVGTLTVTDSAGVDHVLPQDGTVVSGVAAGATTGAVFDGTYDVTNEDGLTASCEQTARVTSASVIVLL